MSALSNCVTCGIVFHAWLRCSAVLRRMPVIGLRSTSPHFAKSGSAGPTMPARAVPLAAAAWPLLPRLFITRLANSFTSSCVMRPPGPVPGTCVTSTPISRASRRTDGAAGADVTCDWRDRRRRAAAPRRCGRPLAMFVTDARGLSGACGASGCLRCLGCCGCFRCRVPLRCFGASGFGASALVAPVAPEAPLRTRGTFSSVRTACPGLTLSPALTLISVTLPATSEGTSIVALSVSSSSTG